MDDYLLERTVNEIYIPQVIVSMAPKPDMPIGSKNLESISNSYSFGLDRALFDSVVEGVSDPLRDFVSSISTGFIIPSCEGDVRMPMYGEDVRIPMMGYDTDEWEGVLDGVLKERKRIRDLIRGEERDHRGDIAVAKINKRDYLLEVVIRAVEMHTTEQERLRVIRKFEDGGFGPN